MIKQFELKAYIGDTIEIIDLDIKARILCIVITHSRIMYEVNYFYNGERKTATLDEWEFKV